MRVCMVAYSFYESDTRIRQYSMALAGRGDTVDVIALKRHGQPDHQVLEGVNVYRIQKRTINERGPFAYLTRIMRFLIRSGIVVARMHRGKKYDVVHVHSVPDFLVFAAVVPKLRGARVILDIHDILPEFYASKFKSSQKSLAFKFLALAEKASIAFSDHTIIANQLWRERLISRSVTADKCTAIENFPDTNMFRPMRHESNGHFRVIYPGTLNHHQGVDIALKAFAKIADDIPESQFDIYGDGPDKSSLIKLSQDLGLSHRVRFHDFLPTKEIASIMAQADLAIVPKRASSAFGTEAASTKIMEFMAMGVPLIVSRTKIDTYYFDDSQVKFFESENVSDLAACILEMQRNSAERERLSRNGTCYARAHCWENKKQVYLQLVDSLIVPTVSPNKDDIPLSSVNGR
jgi:glycosyltransferase involved in cell wall biosynthesis